uniref:Uncharacterized protein n=1 Tax=Romanomermis culicivorax TaxID=13658 RepID=A0A915I9J5_ROMCU
QENYAEAEQNFRAAVESVIKTQEITFRSTKSSSSFGGGPSLTNADFSWEPLLNNLGHTLRKLKRYDEALEWHTKALKLLPRDASTLASIGYCHMFLENFDAAVDYFHQSLSIKRDDTFIAGILSKCMEIMCDSTYAARTLPLGANSVTFSMIHQQQNSNISMASGSSSKDDMDLTPIS